MLSNLCCSNSNKAEQICMNANCTAVCSYICLKEGCCQDQHQACAFVGFKYFNRKVSQIRSKNFEFNMQNFLNLHQQATKTLKSIETFLSEYSILSIIKNITNPSGNIDSDHKITLTNFINSPLKQQPYIHPQQLEQQLSSLHSVIDQYLIILRTNIAAKDNQSGLKKSQIRSKKILSSPAKSNVKSELKSNLLSQKLQVKQQSIVFSNVKPEIMASKSSKITTAFKRFNPKAPYYSQITDQTDIIKTFFYHPIVNAKLLYRASQHQYLASRFHQLCDGIPNTLVLVLTQFQRVIGGFTPLPWSSKGQWHRDPKSQTFLFSLSESQRYPLVNKQKAIWCSKSFGPSFGYPDLQISDKSLYNKKSCVNFPQCFNNSNYKLCPESIQFFCGSATGSFKILQWQVYELIF